MTKEELRELAQSSYESDRGVTGSSGTYADGFEACYRLLTTPRPMEEAPRDRTVILGTPNVVITWSPVQKRWYSNGLLYKDDDFTGWLPIWTPLEDEKKDA